MSQELSCIFDSGNEEGLGLFGSKKRKELLAETVRKEEQMKQNAIKIQQNQKSWEAKEAARRANLKV